MEGFVYCTQLYSYKHTTYRKYSQQQPFKTFQGTATNNVTRPTNVTQRLLQRQTPLPPLSSTNCHHYPRPTPLLADERKELARLRLNAPSMSSIQSTAGAAPSLSPSPSPCSGVVSTTAAVTTADRPRSAMVNTCAQDQNTATTRPWGKAGGYYRSAPG